MIPTETILHLKKMLAQDWPETLIDTWIDEMVQAEAEENPNIPLDKVPLDLYTEN